MLFRSPTSVRSALDLLRDLRGARRAIVVIGTMRELGGEEEALHQEVAREVLDLGPDAVVAVGSFVKAFHSLGDRLSATKFVAGETPEDVAARIRACLKYAPPERLVFAPDCGLSKTARWAARQKLATWWKAPDASARS